MTSSATGEMLFERLREIVGLEGLLADPAAVEFETRTCIPYRQVPDCVVYPRSVEEVQKVVLLANELRVPIWPVSTGKNWGYGEKSACYQGGITMVLERMKRIEAVDETLGYAVIEPGVTYGDLNAHLKTHNLALWADCAGTTQSASVIGNALDKGRGLTPYADHFGCLCGMEVVLPNGSLLRTGNVTQTPNKVWNIYKWGVGPYLDGLFAQSNLGIVVKAGIWLMPAPEAFDFLAFEYSKSLDQFPALIDDLRRLVFQGVLRSRPHLANDFAMLCILSQYPRDQLGRDFFYRGQPEEVIKHKDVTYAASLLDLMRAYARIRTRDEFRPYAFDRENVFTMEQALERMRGLIGYIGDWSDLTSFLPEGWDASPARRRSATAAHFAAVLELAKRGQVKLRQRETFAPLQIRRAETP